MTRYLSIALLLILAGCGADGPPIAMETATEPGITVSGDAQIGVVVQNP
jgi:predicted small lipoprotein YifL